MKAKVLSLLLALAMVASMFAACKKDDGGNTSGTGDDGNTPTETVKLTYWHWGEAPKDAEAVIPELNKKSKADINVEIDFIWATGDPTKLKTALSTGATDDICHTQAIGFSSFAQSGMFYDMTELLQTEAKDLYEAIPEGLWQADTIQDKIWAVPIYKDCAGVYYWYCNKDYVYDKADAQAEFEAAAGADLELATPLMKKVYDYNKSSGDAYPHDLTAPLTINFQGLRGINVSKDEIVLNDARIVLPEDGDQLQLTWATTSYLKNLKTMNSWYKAGYVNQDCETLQKEPDYNIIQSAIGWEGAEITAWGAGKDYTVTIARRTETPILTAAGIQGCSTAIFANSKHPKEAIKYIEYMNLNADYRNMLGYGVEGRNWEANDDGTITQLNTDWYPGNWIQASFFNGLKVVSPAPADMYEKMAKVQATAVPARSMGFVPDITPVETEVAACSAVIEKWNTQFVCGTMADVDAALASAQAELKAAGWEKVRDELQQQLDTFLGK
jgi:putative aldouronate transport system substrate-binding protein